MAAPTLLEIESAISGIDLHLSFASAATVDDKLSVETRLIKVALELSWASHEIERARQALKKALA